MVSSVEISGVGPSLKSCSLPTLVDRSARLDSDVVYEVPDKVGPEAELVTRKRKCELHVRDSEEFSEKLPTVC